MTGRFGRIVAAIAAVLSALYLLLDGWASLFPPRTNIWLFAQMFLPEDLEPVLDSARVTSWLIALGFLGALCYAALRFWLWSRARRGRGSILLLSAAILGATPLFLQTYGFVLNYVPASRFLEIPMPWLVLTERTLTRWGWVLAPLALVLLGAGLWRSRLVSRWIACLAIVAGVLIGVSAGWPHEVSPGIITTYSGLTDAAFVPAVVTEVAFLFALAVSLGLDAVRDSGHAVEQAHPAEGAR